VGFPINLLGRDPSDEQQRRGFNGIFERFYRENLKGYSLRRDPFVSPVVGLMSPTAPVA
jgi:hypothetical protein